MYYLHRVVNGLYIDYKISDFNDVGGILVCSGSKEDMTNLKQDLSILCGMEVECIKSYREGRCCPLQDIIDALRG